MPSADRSPRVSVILRTRNRPEMLRDALQDILSQTFSDLEIGEVVEEMARAIEVRARS